MQRVEMAFYNEETRFPNLFLAVALHDAKCFCGHCRHRKIAAITDKREATLRHAMAVDIPNERRARALALFEVTKKQIVYGKLYRDTCMATTHYTYFKSWAKHQPAYQRFVNGDADGRAEFDKHCQLVNEAAYCFENWELITRNLTDQRMTSIDARSFSVNYFAASASIDWCIEYNEKIRKSTRRTGGDRLYTSEQVDEIFRHIVGTGILHDIEFNESIAASIGGQIQRKMVSYCRRNRR